MFEHLFQPLKLGDSTLPNRICFGAHRTNFAKRGRLNDRAVAYYARRAAGGCGLIVLGDISIEPGDRPWQNMFELQGPEAVGQLRSVARAVHEQGSLLFAQLCHHGFQSSGAITRRVVLGPSALGDIAFGETGKAMEPEDLEALPQTFARAAARAAEGGLDGVEVDVGPLSLLRQFLSPISNFRPDEYGGSPENRLRLAVEVIAAVRQEVGDGFTLGVDLCVDEQFWGGIDAEQAVQFARTLEETGQVDYLKASVGTYYNLHLLMPSMHVAPGFALEAVEQVHQAVNLPVLAGQQINAPQMAQEVLGQGQADGICLVRALICDPDLPNKAKQGQADQIRPCLRDNQGCIGRINQSKPLSCILNPVVGYEAKSSDPPAKTANPKKVMVVGAGPAGLNAALSAAARGHQVTVYEKEPQAGGQLNLARLGAGRQGIYRAVDYLKHMLDLNEVPLITGQEVTPEFVAEINPDAVIVATGSRPQEKPLPGQYGPPGVLSVPDVLAGAAVGDKVLFVDQNGGHHATATAEWLAEKGKQVDMVTSDLFIGIELAPIGDLYLSRQRLLHKGASFTTDVRVERIEGTQVWAREIYTNQEIVYQGYDTVVLDLDNAVQDRLYHQLKGLMKELYRVGDCVAPRDIGMAVWEGRKAGEDL